MGIVRLSTHRDIKVFVDDQVSGGCWENPKASKNAVEIEFLRSGFNVIGEGEVAFSLFLSAFGYSVEERSCVAHINLMHRRALNNSLKYEEHILQNLSIIEIRHHGILMNGPKSNFDTEVRDGFIELVQSFILEINKERIKFYNELNNPINNSNTEARSFLLREYGFE